MDPRHLTNDPSTPATAASHSHRLAAPRRAPTRAPTDGGAGDARQEQRADLAAWLTAGRTARGLTRDQVARVTRIQLRTLERLEEGRFDELPADVFVRGFIRSLDVSASGVTIT